VAKARELAIPHHVGMIASGDLFYDETDSLEHWKRLGVLALEMETNQLYTLAAKFRRQALSIVTVSDMMDGSGNTSSEERESGFRNMVQLALAAI
jgi:purine-nucleoside phosphorylase